MIKVKDLSYFYDDVLALDRINFFMKKEKVALLGSNGSGKSTLLRILGGLYFGKGEYWFDGKKITKRSVNKEFRRSVGILFQNPESMIFNPSVFDEIAFSLREFGFSDIKERVIEIAKRFKIEHLLKKSPLNLSGGEKQKVMLASILVYEPKVLFLDEPTAAMDPRTTGWFIDFMNDIEIPFILATHDLQVAYESCKRGVVMGEEHKILWDGDIDELMGDEETLLKANLVYKSNRKRKFINSKYHLI